MWIGLFGCILLMKISLAFQENMFAYFNTPDCPEGWKKYEGGAFLIGQEQEKQNLQKNFDGTYSLFKKNYEFGKKGGSMRTSLNIDSMPSHHHTFQKTAQGEFEWKTGNSDPFLINSFITDVTSDVGGNQPFDIMPEYYVATLCLYTAESIDAKKLLNVQVLNSEEILQSIKQLVTDGQQSINQSYQNKLAELNANYFAKLQEIKEYGTVDLTSLSKDSSTAVVALVFAIISLIINIFFITQFIIKKRKEKLQNKQNNTVPNINELIVNYNNQMRDIEQQKVMGQETKDDLNAFSLPLLLQNQGFSDSFMLPFNN